MPPESEEEAPAPETEAEPQPERTFPEKVVTDLRQEAARYRTERNVYRDAFEGFEDAERDVFLDMVANLRDNPEQALDQFQGVTSRLAKQLGKETPAMNNEPTPEATPVPEPSPTPTPQITADEIKAMVAEGVNQVLQTRDDEAAKRREVDETLAQAEQLGFTSPDQKAQLFAKAQEWGSGLEEAANAISGSFQSALDSALRRRSRPTGSTRKAPALAIPPRPPRAAGTP